LDSRKARCILIAKKNQSNDVCHLLLTILIPLMFVHLIGYY